MLQAARQSSILVVLGILWACIAFVNLDLALFPGAEILGVVYELGIVSIFFKLGRLRLTTIIAVIIAVVVVSYIVAGFLLLLLCQFLIAYHNSAICGDSGLDIGVIILGTILTSGTSIGWLFINWPSLKKSTKENT